MDDRTTTICLHIRTSFQYILVDDVNMILILNLLVAPYEYKSLPSDICGNFHFRRASQVKLLPNCFKIVILTSGCASLAFGSGWILLTRQNKIWKQVGNVLLHILGKRFRCASNFTYTEKIHSFCNVRAPNKSQRNKCRKWGVEFLLRSRFNCSVCRRSPVRSFFLRR